MSSIETSNQHRALREATGLVQLLDALPIPIIRFDRGLRYDYFNRAALDLLGRSAAELIGLTNDEVSEEPALAAELDASLRHVFATTIGTTFDYLDDRTGGPAVRATLAPQLDADGTVAHVIVVAADITDLAAIQRQLVEREALLRVVLDLTVDSIVRFDADLRYDYVNDRTVEMVGLPRERWIGRNLTDLGYPADVVAVREERLRRVFHTGEPATYEDEQVNLESLRWYESQLFPQLGTDGSVLNVIVVARDITGRKLAEAELVRAAEHDPLTGLANRVALVEEIERAIESGSRAGLATAVLLVDLDHFKHVNDSLGHAVGDELLCRAADRLHQCVRAGDLVARHGGDEFVVVMRNLHDPTESLHLAERIVAGFRRPLVTGDTELSTTASVGISLSSATDTRLDAHDLIREADTAMYVAKNAGRDGISLFDEQLHAAVDERLRIENELRSALARKELAVWYQPEVSLATGEVRAVEALLRWHHPSGELYPAGRFIDVAADTGLIVEIGNWALQEICAHAGRWSERGIRVRVNLAPRQLDDPDLLDKIDHAVAGSGFDRSYLCAEITETALLHDTPTVRDNLDGLSKRGIEIALDDFGTGYASLTYLRRYDIDVIKVDRSFITNIATSERDQRLTAAVVALAHQLDITVTAEGVEHADQAAIVRDLGCAGAQGHLYGPAVPAEEIDRILDAGPLGPGH